jgi:hypothetical protein
MLIPLGLNSTNLSSGKLIKNIRLAGDRGNSLVSATVTNNMFRVRSSHKSLTVYLEVPSNWTEKYIIANPTINIKTKIPTFRRTRIMNSIPAEFIHGPFF